MTHGQVYRSGIERFSGDQIEELLVGSVASYG